MPLFSDVQNHNDGLWRKALGAIVAVADYSVPAITSILDPTDGTLAALPTGWTQLGRPSEDGITWPRETEVSELYGMGSTNPGRSDVRRSTKRVSMTLLESRRKVMEVAYGMSLTGVTPTLRPATTGNPEVTFDEPSLPVGTYRRLIVIAYDVTGTGQIYIARQLLRCKVTEVGEQTWSDGDAVMSTPLTLTAYHDNPAGTAVRHFRAGPGFAEVVTNEGWV